MKLHIVARGKMGRGPEADLIERYTKRIPWPFAITELPDSGGKPVPVAAQSRIIALDEGGEQISSVEFASLLERWRDQGVLAVSIDDERLSWPEKELVRQLGDRLYGPRPSEAEARDG